MVFIPGPSDPFYELMQPPANETPAQKTARQKRELDAQRHSDGIDDDIKQERAEAKKQRGVIKVLLLGQSESGEFTYWFTSIRRQLTPHVSGKSTTLKSKLSSFTSTTRISLAVVDFRMQYAKDEWSAERKGWRAVVQLNVVRPITTILRVLEAEMNGDSPVDSEDDQTSASQDSSDEESFKFTDRHQLLMIRLAPLLGVEGELKRRLGAGSEHARAAAGPMSATPFDEPEITSKRKLPEFSVRSWKDVLAPEERHSQSTASSSSSKLDIPTDTIVSCRDDMKALWNDKTVRLALKRRKLKLPDSVDLYVSSAL